MVSRKPAAVRRRPMTCPAIPRRGRGSYRRQQIFLEDLKYRGATYAGAASSSRKEREES